MHRDWELVDVLASEDASIAEGVRALIDAGRREEAMEYLGQAEASSPVAANIVDDLVTALRASHPLESQSSLAGDE